MRKMCFPSKNIFFEHFKRFSPNKEKLKNYTLTFETFEFPSSHTIHVSRSMSRITSDFLPFFRDVTQRSFWLIQTRTTLLCVVINCYYLYYYSAVKKNPIAVRTAMARAWKELAWTAEKTRSEQRTHV